MSATEIPVETLVTPDELAATLHAYAGTPDPIPWELLDDASRRRLVIQARRTLERLGDRRLADPHRHAIAKLKSAAREISEDASSAVEDALSELNGGLRTDSGKRAILDLIQRLDDDGHIDLIAGATPIENALRRARDEAQR